MRRARVSAGNGSGRTMTKLLVRMVMGGAIVAGMLVSAPARGESLAGLEDQLNGTGRCGTFVPESAMHIAPGAVGAAAQGRDAQQAAARADEHATVMPAAPTSGADD